MYKAPSKLFYKYRGVKDFDFLKDIIVSQRLYAADHKTFNDALKGEFQYNTKELQLSFLEPVETALSLTRVVALSRTPQCSKLWDQCAESQQGVCIGVSLHPDANHCPIIYSDTPFPVRRFISKEVAMHQLYARTTDEKSFVNAALEMFGFTFDPVTRKLIPPPGELLTSVHLENEMRRMRGHIHINLSRGMMSEDVIAQTVAMNILSQKQKAWQDEQEERVFVLGGDQFAEVRIKEIIFGARIDKKVKDSILDLVEGVNKSAGVQITTKNCPS